MNEIRYDLLNELGCMSSLYPSMRFGQVIELVTTLAGAETVADLEKYTDAELLQVATEHIGRRLSQIGLGVVAKEPLTSERRQLISVLHRSPHRSHGSLAVTLTRLARELNTTLYDIEDDALLQRLNPRNAVA